MPIGGDPAPPSYQELTAIAEYTNSFTCPYLTCVVRCETKVLIGEIRDAMRDKMIEEVAIRVAKEWAKKALPYYGWINTSTTVYEAVECLVDCHKKK